MFETIEKIADLRERLASSTKVEPYTAVPARPIHPTPPIHPTRLTHPTRPTHPVGLVPTMGALHAGHAELVKNARRECGGAMASHFAEATGG